jgi:nitrogenase molybdenum-iron protein NifN
MATLVSQTKSCAENPLKSSTPLGAALAYLGIDGAMPLFHGSQGCTSFALVLAVRHFKEAIPLQTTAMDEPATVLGGAQNLAQALVNIQNRAKPKFIGIASTALVETRGEDIAGELKNILRDHSELADTRIVFASTPDFEGALEDGWSRAVLAIIEAIVPETGKFSAESRVINVLPGVHETPGSLEELADLAAEFGLETRFLPNLARAVDGHVPDKYIGTSFGGTQLAEIEAMGEACHTIAIGSHMGAPASLLEKRTGVPSTVFPSLLGLGSTDHLVSLLMRLSGRSAPDRVKRDRSRLVDAMLDGHFSLSGRKVAVAADPDLLSSLVHFLSGLGAKVVTAISSTKYIAGYESLPCESVLVGDLGDLEHHAKLASAELLVTHSHGRQAAEALHIPLLRIGFPIFDRLGHAHRSLVGYRGTRELVFEFANTFLGEHHAVQPSDFAPPAPAELCVEAT